MGNVIGFVDWPDFLAELQVNQPRGNVVRVQNFIKKKASRQIGRVWVNQCITVAAVTEGDDVLVALFSPGGAWDSDLKHNEARLKELEERVKSAISILTDALTKAGFVVRPGIIAGSETAKVVTTPTGLWRWEDGKLIPETEGSFEAVV